MKTKHPIPEFLVYLFLQALRMAAMYIATAFLLLHVATDVTHRMQHWPLAYYLFLFSIEVCIGIVLFELREHFVKGAGLRFRSVPGQYMRAGIIFSNIIAVCGIAGNLYFICTIPDMYTLPVLVQLLLLMALTWAAAGVAVPLSAARFWKKKKPAKPIDVNQPIQI
ncbi:MAG: hypothetical protein ABIS69_05180 [Sediminibacterium sp.]